MDLRSAVIGVCAAFVLSLPAGAQLECPDVPVDGRSAPAVRLEGQGAAAPSVGCCGLSMANAEREKRLLFSGATPASSIPARFVAAAMIGAVLDPPDGAVVGPEDGQSRRSGDPSAGPQAGPVALPAGRPSATPEPWTLLLLGAGMVALALSSRRWNRRFSS